MRFLFWNLNNRPVGNLVAEISHEHRVDVILLSECSIPVSDLLVHLNAGGEYRYTKPDSLSKSVAIYAKLPERSFKPVRDTARLSLREIQPPVGVSVLLAVAHFPSKLYQDEIDQFSFATRIAREIDEAEQTVGHTRTVLVGDLNMAPFEPGVVGADGLHAMMDRRIAAREQRTVRGESRKFFYNPMWGLLGDKSPGPPGTYFYESSKQVSYFWYTFDQVLVRPAIVSQFVDEELKVLTTTRSANLLAYTGVPDVSAGSDHLPILFAITSERSV